MANDLSNHNKGREKAALVACSYDCMSSLNEKLAQTNDLSYFQDARHLNIAGLQLL